MDRPKKTVSRRKFIKKNVLGAGYLLAAGAATQSMAGPLIQNTAAPGLLGGDPVRTAPWPKWPQWNPETDEKRVLEVLRSGVWSRSGVVTEFEKKWAETVGAKRCLSLVNGTNAMITSLIQLDVGGGDEVIVPPYTFIATVAAVIATG